MTSKRPEARWAELTSHALRTPLTVLRSILDGRREGESLSSEELEDARSATRTITALADILRNTGLAGGDETQTDDAVLLGLLRSWAEAARLPVQSLDSSSISIGPVPAGPAKRLRSAVTLDSLLALEYGAAALYLVRAAQLIDRTTISLTWNESDVMTLRLAEQKHP